MALEDELRARIERYENEDIERGTMTDDLLAVGELVVVHKDTILAALTERKAPVEVEGLVERLRVLGSLNFNGLQYWNITDPAADALQSQATELATLKQQLAEREEALREIVEPLGNEPLLGDRGYSPGKHVEFWRKLAIGYRCIAARTLTRTDGGDQ